MTTTLSEFVKPEMKQTSADKRPVPIRRRMSNNAGAVQPIAVEYWDPGRVKRNNGPRRGKSKRN